MTATFEYVKRDGTEVREWKCVVCNETMIEGYFLDITADDIGVFLCATCHDIGEEPTTLKILRGLREGLLRSMTDLDICYGISSDSKQYPQNPLGSIISELEIFLKHVNHDIERLGNE